MTDSTDPVNAPAPVAHPAAMQTAQPPPPDPAAHPFTMDGHQDAILYAEAHGGTAVFDAGWPGAQLDLPGLWAGQVDAAWWAIFIAGENQAAYDPAACVADVDATLRRYRTWLDANPAYRLIGGVADLYAVAEAAGAAHGAPAPFGVLLHCEGARGIAGPDHLAALHAAGLRSVGLTWNGANRYATGAHGEAAAGLSTAGKDLVRALNALHMVIDGAHLNRQGLWDLLEVSTAPVLVTHTACAALYRHPRNLEDDQIRAVAARGGTIGIFYANRFLAPAGTPVPLETIVAHYDHLLELVGPEHVALGTDYGGIGSGLPAGLEQAADLPRLYAALAAHGYPAPALAALRGGNYRRVLGTILT